MHSNSEKMTYSKLLQYLDTLQPVSEALNAQLRSRLILQHFRKGQALPDSKVDRTWFIISGLLKARFHNEDGQEIITRLWAENELVLFKSPIGQRISSKDDKELICLEDVTMLFLSQKDANHLLKDFPETSLLLRKIYLADLHRQQLRALLLSMPAKKAYSLFCQLFPSDRLLLKDIAAFLNIRAYTLSRLRRQK